MIDSMTIDSTYLAIYLLISVGFVLVNSLIAGFNGSTWDKKDILESILWPISLGVFIGLLVRVLFERIRKSHQ